MSLEANEEKGEREFELDLDGWTCTAWNGLRWRADWESSCASVPGGGGEGEGEEGRKGGRLSSRAEWAEGEEAGSQRERERKGSFSFAFWEVRLDCRTTVNFSSSEARLLDQ